MWSWGVNDEAALGRQTLDVTDPDEPSQLVEPEILEFQPTIIRILAEEGFRLSSKELAVCESTVCSSERVSL